MSKIEQLIKSICPNGVEFKKLSEITNLTAGDRIIKSMMDDNMKYPVYGGGVLPTGKYNNYNFEHSITISRAGSAGFVNWVEGKFWATDVCFVASEKEKKYNIKYIFYYVKNMQNELQKKIYGGNLPKLNKDYLWKLKIPIPPLEVQDEIVHILDDFTLLSAELSAELSTELKARQKQYDYYTEKVLSEVEADTISVGEVCETITDYVAAGSFGEIAKKVKYLNEPDYAQLIRTVDIKNNFKKSDYIYIDEKAFEFLWRVNLNEECIILPNIGVNCGEVYYVTPEDLIYKNNVLGPNAILLRSKKNNNKYLSYVFKTRDFQKQLRKIISPAGQTKFNKTELKKLIIKLPSIEKQNEIAEKIEKMDKIMNSISEGLPAEIEARKKQYEYYRDRLLTFKELKVNEG